MGSISYRVSIHPPLAFIPSLIPSLIVPVLARINVTFLESFCHRHHDSDVNQPHDKNDSENFLIVIYDRLFRATWRELESPELPLVWTRVEWVQNMLLQENLDSILSRRQQCYVTPPFDVPIGSWNAKFSEQEHMHGALVAILVTSASK